MLFNINKEKSLQILKAAMALIIVLFPSLGGLIPPDCSVYVVFIISSLLFMMRLKKTEKLKLSIFHFIFLTLLFYSVISFLFVSNKSGHITYITLILAITVFFSDALDYFDENSPSNVRRRMMYMLLAGGTACAVINILYWIFMMVPYGIKDSFFMGLGSSDYLAVFMMVCSIVSFMLLKGNSKKRRILIILAILLMVFVFIMAKSLWAWMIAAMIGIIYAASLKTKKMLTTLSVSCFLVFVAIILFAGNHTDYGSLFKDMFSYGFKNIFGFGGGFESFKELYITKTYAPNIKAGLLPMLCTASGGVGILCTLCIFIRAFIQFIKLKTWESIIGVFVTIMLLLLPFSDNYIVLFLWAGLISYNEQSALFINKKALTKGFVRKTYSTLLVLCVVAAVFLSHFVIKNIADKEYECGKYMSSYSFYKSASALNIFDADSVRGGAMSLYKEGNEDYLDKALELSISAQKRNKKDMDNVVTKAKIYYAQKNYELAAQEYRIAASNVLVKDKYNLSLSKVLYKIVRTGEKGSSETKRAYEEILKIAKVTDDLNYKKKINDIADKALIYTKGEFNDGWEN